MSKGISRRGFLRGSAGLLVGAAASSADGKSAPVPRKRPNVLLVFDDQLRAQALSFNGETNIATPNIDRLARQGIVFTNAISTCPLCTPYRGMLQTGRYPTHTGLVLNWVNINPRERCQGERAPGVAVVLPWPSPSSRRRRVNTEVLCQPGPGAA